MTPRPEFHAEGLDERGIYGGKSYPPRPDPLAVLRDLYYTHYSPENEAAFREALADVERLVEAARWAASCPCLEPNEEGVSVCEGECATCRARTALAPFKEEM